MQAQDLLPGVPIVESLLFDQVAAQKGWDAETTRVARELHEQGYAELDFPDPDFDSLADEIKRSLHDLYDWEEWRRQGWAKNEGMRIQDAWKFNDTVKRIACNQRILEMLSAIYGRRAWPFQTLNFPVGTQQHYHSDSVHFSTIPERFMCGVWVALEDISEDAGPLVYYPGSHRWPILYNELIGFRVADKEAITQSIYEETWRALVSESKVELRSFAPKKGRALIWSANLLHGGGRQKNSGVTRWSQVSHYFFDGCCYIRPMLSNAFLGQLTMSDVTDIGTGEQMPNIYMGKQLSKVLGTSPGVWKHIRDELSALVGRVPPDFDPRLYLDLNPDVLEAKIDAADHYLRHGRKEGRRYC